MDFNLTDVPSLTPEVLRQLQAALADLRYGSVELCVHDGRVVQIETRHKIRLGATDSPTTSTCGPTGPPETPAKIAAHRPAGGVS